MKINVHKSGIMQIQQQKMKRDDVKYVIDNDEILMVNQYKYLGDVIDEHLDMNDMIEEKAVAGKKALGAWFNLCRVDLGDIGVGTCRKLMSSLVESTMLYGMYVWHDDYEKWKRIYQLQQRMDVCVCMVGSFSV